MRPDLHADITKRLQADYGLKLGGREQKWLQGGRCPSCGQKELFARADEPWFIRCGRENKCGFEEHVKDLYRELFDNWSDRFKSAPDNPHAAADAYLQMGRGLDLTRLRGTYTQEYFYSRELRIGSATVRFHLGGGVWWERIIDQAHRFGKRKAGFGYGQSYSGRWWQLPDSNPEADELWLVEGIFDAAALEMHGIAARSLMTCNVYPEQALQELAKRCEQEQRDRPRLVWAFDAGPAGERYTHKFIERARNEGWTCTAAYIPQPKDGRKLDWNEVHQRGQLTERDIEEYRYQGQLLIAPSAKAKALLMYKRRERGEFHFRYGNRLYWFRYDDARYAKAREAIERRDEDGKMTPEEIRDEALTEGGVVVEIANCYPEFLYYQANALTDEAWYYVRVWFPHSAKPKKCTFTAGQLSAGTEFKKRLMHVAPGTSFSGSTNQLDRVYCDATFAIKSVETIDYLGYSREHGAYVWSHYAVKGGTLYPLNDEDYFDIGRLAIKSLNGSLQLAMNADLKAMRTDWPAKIYACYGAKGIVTVAFWFGALFAEQLRARYRSFPFLEMSGEPGTGKTALIDFLWRLVGRTGHEGIDIAKGSLAGRWRHIGQTSNLPVVLMESDRKGEDNASKAKAFDWNEVKTLFNGHIGRVMGVKNGGNDTHDPPFRGALLIEQNASVQADEAVMQRICQMTFDKSLFNDENQRIADELEAMPVEDVSGFAIAAAMKEAAVMQMMEAMYPQYRTALAANPKVSNTRLIHNHAQLMALVDALRIVVPLSDEMVESARQQIHRMAAQRQQRIADDHERVTEFWELFDHIDGKFLNSGDRIELNHSKDKDLIAINLPEFVERLASRNLRLPCDSVEMKRLLQTSRRRKFIRKNCVVNSEIRRGSTVRCWVFRKEGKTR